MQPLLTHWSLQDLQAKISKKSRNEAPAGCRIVCAAWTGRHVGDITMSDKGKGYGQTAPMQPQGEPIIVDGDRKGKKT
jgi:hypothetical protein